MTVVVPSVRPLATFAIVVGLAAAAIALVVLR
jgi:hypothetical protein